MKVTDRGTKKWVSLMLPEHVELLNRAFIEHREKPILDQQQMAVIDQKLKYALNKDVHLKITFYKDGNYEKIRGRLVRIDQWQGCIILLNEDGFTMALSNIIDVEID